MGFDKELMKIRFRSIEEFIPHRQSLQRICEKGCRTVDGLALFVALNEAVNNVFFHGNSDIPEGVVDLAVRTDGSWLCVDIHSTGRELPLPFLADHSLSPGALRESGRGLYIIRSLVDEFSIKKRGSLLTLCMEKHPGKETIYDET